MDTTIEQILKGLLRNGPLGVGEAKSLVLDYANKGGDISGNLLTVVAELLKFEILTRGGRG